MPTTTQIEHSAGAVLVARIDESARALLIRVRADGYELPKGHIEKGESAEGAAQRELREETSITSPVTIGEEVGHVAYTFERDGVSVHKQVTYFVARTDDGSPEFGPRPKGTRELKWIGKEEIDSTPLVSQDLEAILLKALEIRKQGD